MSRPAIQFVLVREGSSDDGLVNHLRSLLIAAGAGEVTGTARNYKGSVDSQLLAVSGEKAAPHIIFVHRDSDARTEARRRAEIKTGAKGVSLECEVVPVIPVQELEAWLLLDEAGIREVAGRPSGRHPLHLPKVKHVEQTASPKEVLRQALIDAGETSGRNRRKASTNFPKHRKVLLDRLDINGPVTQLPAWQSLVRDIEQALRSIAEQPATKGD